MILPDTSIWIDFLGRKPGEKAEWLRGEMERKSKVYICSPILQEVLQGASNDVAFGRIRKQLESLPWASADDAKFTAILAARLYAKVRWAGLTVRSPNDCLIASSAIEHDLTELHNDRDFESIAKIEPRLKLA